MTDRQVQKVFEGGLPEMSYQQFAELSARVNRMRTEDYERYTRIMMQTREARSTGKHF